MPVLRFDETYRQIFTLGRLAGIPMPWYNTGTPLIKAIFKSYHYSQFVFMIAKIFCAANACFRMTNFVDIVFAAADQIGLMANAPFLTAFYALSLKKITKITQNMDQLCDAILNAGLGRPEVYEKLYYDDAKLFHSFIKIMGPIIIMCPVVFIATGPIFGLINGTYGTQLSIPIHCQFEENNRSIYEIVAFFEFWGLFLPVVQKMLHEFMMIAIFRNQTTYLKYLRVALKEVEENSIQDPKNTQEKLRIWIKLHQETLRNAHDIIDLFSPVIVFFNMDFIVLLAGGVLVQLYSVNNNIFQLTMIGLYQSLLVVQFYIQCHMADELTIEGESLATAAYSIPWYTLDHKNKGFIRLIINIGNRPLQIMGYRAPAFTLNREIFVSFMASSISAYMAFRTVMENVN
nr:olfactory receptor 16 [Tropidothorax elegans]